MSSPLPAPDRLSDERAQRARRLWLRWMLAPQRLVGTAIAVAVGAVVAPPVGVAAIALVAAFGWGVAVRRSHLTWWGQVTAELGLEHGAAVAGGPWTPLLRSGTEDRRVLRTATDGRRDLVILRREDVSRDPSRSQRDLDCTLVVYMEHDPALRYLAAHPEARAAASDARRHAPITTQTLDLPGAGDLVVTCGPGDAAASRSLLAPALLERLAACGAAFEYEEGTLVVYLDGELERVDDYRALLRLADRLADALMRRAALAA